MAESFVFSFGPGLDPGTLTPQGAHLLRQARERIIAHPEEFDWGTWECGTQACVAGHIVRILVGRGRAVTLDTPEIAARALGFPAIHFGSPLCYLFGMNPIPKAQSQANDAAAAINRFLWHYGYPPDELTTPTPIPTPVMQQKELV